MEENQVKQKTKKYAAKEDVKEMIDQCRQLGRAMAKLFSGKRAIACLIAMKFQQRIIEDESPGINEYVELRFDEMVEKRAKKARRKK
jgi:hypothetical protein